MKLCYVDETGTDGDSPVMVMVGIIADSQRLRRTQTEFQAAFDRLGSLPERTIRELKSTSLYRGRGRWQGVPGEQRHEAIGEFRAWIGERKHELALAAIDIARFKESPLSPDIDLWLTGALHIALQVQRRNQGLKKNKGNTFLVFDEQKRKADALADLLFDPPEWTDSYYKRTRRQARLDQIIDTAFYARSHHVGLVQVADLFAFLFRRHAELVQYGYDEEYEGEAERIKGWVRAMSERLIDRTHRWPKRPKGSCAKWYADTAPRAIVDLV